MLRHCWANGDAMCSRQGDGIDPHFSGSPQASEKATNEPQIPCQRRCLASRSSHRKVDRYATYEVSSPSHRRDVTWAYTHLGRRKGSIGPPWFGAATGNRFYWPLLSVTAVEAVKPQLRRGGRSGGGRCEQPPVLGASSQG